MVPFSIIMVVYFSITIYKYLEFYANPDEDAKLDEYKKIIVEEFYPSKGR